jgi:hypothetical protein
LDRAISKEFQYILIDYNNEGHRNYLSKRKYLIECVKHHVELNKLRKSVIYLTVSYIDTIFLTNPIMNYDLVTYVCYLLACKFYEIDTKVHMKCYLFNEEDVKKCEIFCLKALNYKLDNLTAFDALQMMLRIGIIFEETTININFIYRLAVQTIDKFLYDERYVDFSSIQICIGVVASTREHFNLKGWTHELATVYNLKLDDIMNCFFVIKSLYTREEFLLKLNKSNNEINYILPCKYEHTKVYSYDETLSETLNVHNQAINLNSNFIVFPFSRNQNCMYYKDFQENINNVYNLYNSLLY